jgi:hypothetical protein
MNKELKHNIDVMHVGKNISESTFGTMLGIDGKNKDTDKAWMDLEKMNIREILHLEILPDGSCRKPRAIFSLNTTERDGFYDFLKSVKYPDGYAANISRSVNTRNGKLIWFEKPRRSCALTMDSFNWDAGFCGYEHYYTIV